MDEQVKESPNEAKDALILTENLEKLKKRALAYLDSGYSIHFTGPSGVGKTSMALNLAREFDQPIMFMNGRYDMNSFDLLGGTSGYTSSKLVDNFISSVYKKEEKLTPRIVEGRLVEAVKNGYTLIYDEFTRSTPEINNLFLSILEEGVLPLYRTDEEKNYLYVHHDFKVIFTSNPEEYAGIYPSQDALLDRLITLHIDYPDIETESHLLAAKVGLSEKDSERIAKLTAAIRKKCQDKKGQSPSFRASLTIAELAKKYEIGISATDEEFSELANDVLGACLYRALKTERFEKVQKIIQQEVKKV